MLPLPRRQPVPPEIDADERERDHDDVEHGEAIEVLGWCRAGSRADRPGQQHPHARRSDAGPEPHEVLDEEEQRDPDGEAAGRGRDPRSEHAPAEHQLTDSEHVLAERRVLAVVREHAVDVLPAARRVGRLVVDDRRRAELPVRGEQQAGAGRDECGGAQRDELPEVGRTSHRAGGRRRSIRGVRVGPRARIRLFGRATG